ncbi:MAG: N-acetylmuramoyl-L-alanine amidase-like domain-containing protein [Gemmatimonadota bacterium]
MMTEKLGRRQAIRRLGWYAAGAVITGPLLGCRDEIPGADGPAETGAAAERSMPATESELRLQNWVETLRAEGYDSADVVLGLAAVRVGELAIGTPYVAFTLEEYIRAGGSPMRTEPLTLDLERFDCVSLVESCLAVARIARSKGPATWEAFAAEMERMRYRGGERAGYTSRLHYFSDWLHDNERRGLVRVIGEELGGTPDDRPLRFMSRNPDAYPAMAYPEVREEIAEIERQLDDLTRSVVPTQRIAGITDRLQSGDILAFATSIEGLDVTHAAFAYDDDGVMRVLHAPLSGGVVEITSATVPEYVAAIGQSTGILVARPLDG